MNELDLFIAANALADPAQRAAFLDRECAGNAPLRQRLEALLAGNEQSGHPLDHAAIPVTGSFHEPKSLEGQLIAGKYTLVELVGEGGMGSVWRAKQSEPVKRSVAVKLIKAGMDSKQVLARFNAERQALALMDHPNIAKVLDGGVHDNRPFFVMELVKGLPITEYCDQRKLTPKERLELFVPVCQAIQHAHQKGIIHRDIKPSNVLVALYDDRPVVKVIDFGVAKATGGTLTEHTIETGFGGVVGTPQYMSPEQATFNNLDIDTRSDVYALGVLLYELLAGSPPFSKKELEKKGLLEMLRVVREEEPPRPSTKLSSSDALPSLSASRGTEPKKLTGLLRNELDWIVMKALEKNRSRRYETANGFAADVQRYLAGEAVQAHPPSAAYRLKKFVRRYRGQVIATGLVFIALVAGVVGTTLGLFEARRQETLARNAAEQEREAKIREGERAEGERLAKLDAQAQKEQAQKRLSQVEKANALLGSIFSNLDPREIARAERPLQAILVEKLDQAVSQLEGESIGDPSVVATMQHNFACSLLSLGEPAKAVVLLKKAVATLEAKGDPDDQNLLGSKNVLAAAYQEAGMLDLALPLLEESFKAAKAKYGPDHPETLACRNNLGKAYGALGKHALAVPLVEETLKLTRAKLGPRHENTLQAMNALACTYQAAGKPDFALPLWEEALKLMRTELGLTHPTTLVTMQSLGSGYQNVGKPDLAVPLMEEALKHSRAALGPEHPDTLECMRSLAVMYRVAGKFDRSVAQFEEVLKHRRAKFSPDDSTTLTIMNGLGLLYEDVGKLEQGLALKAELFERTKAKLGADNFETLRCMHNLAYSYWLAKRYEKSIPMLEEVLKLKTARFGREPLDTQMTVGNLGVSYNDAGRHQEAIPFLEEAVRASKKYPNLVGMNSHLIDAYMKAGEKTKLSNLLLEQLDQGRKALPPNSPQLAGMLAQIGLGLLEQKKWTEAEPLLRESLAIREKNQPQLWTTFNTQSLLGGVLLGQKKYADAEPLLLKGYEGMKAREKSIPPQASTRIPEALDRLIDLYTAANKPDELKKWHAERAKYPPKQAAKK